MNSKQRRQWTQELNSLCDEIKATGNDGQEVHLVIYSFCALATLADKRRVDYCFEKPKDANAVVPEEVSIGLIYTKSFRLESIVPGNALNPEQFAKLVSLLKYCFLSSPVYRVGRQIVFSAFPVLAAYRSDVLQYQILPVSEKSPNLPRNIIGGANHPFRLEFLCKSFPDLDRPHLALYEQTRRARELLFFLHLAMPYQFWTYKIGSRNYKFNHTWTLADKICSHSQLEYRHVDDDSEIKDGAGFTETNKYSTMIRSSSERYYQMRIDEYDHVVLPENIEELESAYLALSGPRREQFQNSLFWFYSANRAESASQTFLFLIQALEGLLVRRNDRCVSCEQHTHSISDCFAEFLDQYAGDVGGLQSQDRKILYNARSGLAHGGVFAKDTAPFFGFAPQTADESRNLDRAERAVRIGLLNWLLENGSSRPRIPFKL